MENYLEINYEKNMQMLSEAVKYCEENFLHEDLINTLYTDNDLKKQLCLIELNKINSQQEADILVYNLTGHSGPVRKTASYKILELIMQSDYNPFFQKQKNLDTFIKAIVDINPSVSRNSVEIIKYIDNKNYIYSKIIDEINITLSKMEDIRQNRSYNTNKQNFNLYWNLEALISISDSINAGDELINILNITCLSNDYTIREKTAKAAVEFAKCNNGFYKIIEKLKDDDNVYVKKHLSELL
ncbi:hypothetical protein IJ182_05010 [bacterium]|nr:hypothetical protein [bacterium]